ncbi:unnamed protein product (macronuclear) [Paramecium tetraurelia]|uniref:PPM-type phosphatase domain-containing protein n=1 Tax=Paramecium tetraurelia TaxID=5888 RepID=A0EIS7_PARTE|nr:uncharacterized protein GSPATT00027547001 [Paramecium tetraurelia]CAK95218.1 unnamed protein product [Paramecium tetraurelia]|eukprot:XP_001462591.1 hypothetical protein (macronuclear) [Paramecium tetraurelia strain d4-2]
MDLEIVINYEHNQQVVDDLCESFDELEEQNEKYHLYMNRGSRREMLDRYQVSNNHYAIFDGHGSSHVADYLQQNLLQRLQNGMSDEEYKKGMCLAMSITIQANTCNLGLLLYYCLFKIKLLQQQTQEIPRLLYSERISFEQLNSIHIPQSKEEQQRIHKQGGYDYQSYLCRLITKRQNICRVSGSLTVTRSFGDFYLKKYIISEPEIFRYQISEGDRFIVMASDGFWDELSEQEVLQIIQKLDQNKNLAKQLYQAISSDYIRDNVTIMVFPL